jgi:Reverse transcriptase (RNA-dependent DNA polymerase)
MKKCNDTESMEEVLTSVREIVEDVKEQHLKKDVKKRKSWMTNEILELMEQRKERKNNPCEYKRMQTIVRRKIREAKEKEKIEQCEEIERYQSQFDNFNVHRKVKEITGKFRNNTKGKITDEEGNLVITKEEKKRVWEQYLEKLFYDVRAEPPIIEDDTGPEILLEEVMAAIKQLKDGKVCGLDEIPTELLKLLDEEQMKKVTRIFNAIYTAGEIPTDWLKSEFVTLPKKPGAKFCGEYRTISLMSHMLKLFLRIIHNRIYQKCEEQISHNQFGFVNAVGTREALFSVQVLFQRCRDVSCNVFACLIDYQKAFDRVRHKQMMDVLQRTT